MGSTSHARWLGHALTPDLFILLYTVDLVSSLESGGYRLSIQVSAALSIVLVEILLLIHSSPSLETGRLFLV